MSTLRPHPPVPSGPPSLLSGGEPRHASVTEIIHEQQHLVAQHLRTEELVFNMGPQHPATHGVLRVVIKSDGEFVQALQPHVGNLHRSVISMPNRRSAPRAKAQLFPGELR